ncbi:hypothetical protein BV898_12609 [Hypsibius exemplaris]|uniref:Uncharacterized protein n=1 Tax=Hypsibius exemplaris TaxID=2072580 RepID=A0A1W0WD94_HYPEX|nr:hypothetical protein BV898_12609 [Hypsibius exemplaris]
MKCESVEEIRSGARCERPAAPYRRIVVSPYRRIVDHDINKCHDRLGLGVHGSKVHHEFADECKVRTQLTCVIILRIHSVIRAAVVCVRVCVSRALLNCVAAYCLIGRRILRLKRGWAEVSVWSAVWAKM